MPKIVSLSSFASKLGFKVGDDVESLGGYDFIDILDYLYYDNENNFKVRLVRDGKAHVIDVHKKDGQSLGLEFDLEIEPICCKNKCVFCFVDQLPKGLRDTLYVKDDDYRLSFISGSYITFTNVTEEEIKRIIRLKLSPLYISVHAFDDDLRLKLLRNPATLKLISQMKRLGDAGIKMHTQLVIVPEMNDGKELEKSIRGLHTVKGVESVAVVPVGLTGHRGGLSGIRTVSGDEAKYTVKLVEALNEEYGGEFCWCSDEYYLLAEMPLPSFRYYGEFPQIENGVGLVASFDDNLDFSMSEVQNCKLNKKILCVTGTSFAPLMEGYAKSIETKLGVKVSVKGVLNNFFGQSVTVAGLVVGQDIIAQTKDIDADLVLIPDTMLREFTTTFLDNTTVDEVSAAIGKPIVPVAHDGSDMLQKIVDFFR